MSFIYHRTVRFSDTDAAGVVYFANVLSMCHEAYEASLSAVGIHLKEFFGGGAIAVPIVHADINFFQPMYCGEQYTIHVKPTALTDSKFQTVYEIFSSQLPNPLPDPLPNQRVSQATTIHVCVDIQTRRRIPLPPSVVQWLQNEPNETIST